MLVGERIRYFRTRRSLTQKKLAELSFLSEPTLRNYELGYRRPSKQKLEKIANALTIALESLTVPEIEEPSELMHLFFMLEDLYGFKINSFNDELCLTIDTKKYDNASVFDRKLKCWLAKSEQLKNKEITKEEYDKWRYTLSF